MSHRGRKRVVDESESLGGGEDEELTLDKIFTDPTFDPNTLTKLSLRSALSNLGGLAYEDLPPPNAKKQVYLDFFHQNIIAKKNRLWRKNKAIIPDGKGIVVVNQDGSYETTNGTPLKVRKFLNDFLN